MQQYVWQVAEDDTFQDRGGFLVRLDIMTWKRTLKIRLNGLPASLDAEQVDCS